MADYIEGKRPIIEALRTQVPIKRILRLFIGSITSPFTLKKT